MRIKRFLAPDMRTALRMIRDEQGPDAVILSNRAAEGGIEVVSATDYDEALVAQALRAAAPGLETLAAGQATTRPAPPAQAVAHSPVPASVAAAVAVAGAASSPASAATPARESLMSRARAVFRIGDGPAVDGPTLAELSAPAYPSAPAVAAVARRPAMPAQPQATTVAAATADTHSESTQTRFEAMMAALDAAPRQRADAPASEAAANHGNRAGDDANPIPARTAGASPAPAPSADTAKAPAESVESAQSAIAAPTRSLRAVPTIDPQPVDPAILAVREEMARMRQMMELQMEQLSLERLRGSPARAAVIDALLGFGCEDTLARAVAAKIDPALPPSDIAEPMYAELARMLTVAHSEPLDEGGVIALVGPTGAGKTTTAAKLAARFAARHRARDVALVTTDGERAGSREQLQAHGRRLGITVCDAAGPEGLKDALAQLADYPLVLVDTAGHAPRDRALFSQILWLRASRKVRSLLVLPANAHPHDLGEVIRRYRLAAPEGVVLTKLDETGRLGSALSVAVRHGLSLAYTTQGQLVPSDLDRADAQRLVHTLEKSRRAADNPLPIEDRHALV